MLYKDMKLYKATINDGLISPIDVYVVATSYASAEDILLEKFDAEDILRIEIISNEIYIKNDTKTTKSKDSKA